MVILALLATTSPGPIRAEEEPSLEEELESLEEDDFPDLVPADASGEFMEELEFLQDADMVELPARHRQDIGMSPSAVSVLTREDIETSGATSIPDLLRLVPGIEIVNMSPMFLSLTGRLNWNYENNTHLVLLDGRETNVEIMGFSPWVYLPVFLHDIERIEVIRGPGSALYGANALAGVINIVTRAAGETSVGSAFVQAGEWNNLQAGARANLRLGDWRFYLLGGLEQANRWGRDPRSLGKRLVKARLLAEYAWSKDRRLRLDAGIGTGQGILPSAAGDILADPFSMGQLLVEYRFGTLSGRLYFTRVDTVGSMTAPLAFAGIELAHFADLHIVTHTLDGEVQWTVPTGWDPLLVIVGGGARLSNLSSPRLLDAETFTDINSPGYHEPGVEFWEVRSGAFVHAELAAGDWLTMTGGVGVDYNTETGLFTSPRLSAVFRPAGGHFVRLGVARAFRKPSYWEQRLHPDIDFPEDGLFQGSAREQFREFMINLVGNERLENEEVTALEAGYLGRFLDGRLSVGLDLYVNNYTGAVEILSHMVPHESWVIDLEESSFRFHNQPESKRIFGSELMLQFDLSRRIELVAGWTHRQVYDAGTGRFDDRNPKNYLTAGGRFLTGRGLLGSLYLHARSEFWDREVDNPAGLMEPYLTRHLDNAFLVQARLGYRWRAPGPLELEAGAKLFLPVTLAPAGPELVLQERGGGLSPFGVKYGADQLTRVVWFYLTGNL